MKKSDPISKEIERLKEALADEDPYERNYTILLSRLDSLQDLKTRNKRVQIKSDTLVTAGVNLLGILLILNHERLHAVSTKALGFITKLRL